MSRQATNDSTPPPSLRLLDRVIIDSRRGLPLHLQLRHALRSLIENNFEDGQLFWPEMLLAEHLKLSRGTVRQALGELAREGLLRRSAAGSTVVKETEQGPGLAAIGVFVAQYDSDFISVLLQQIAGECRARGLPLKLYHTHRGEETAHAYAQVQSRPDQEGLILLETARTNLELFEAFRDRGFRTVMLGMNNPDPNGASLDTDAALAVRLGMEHLLSLGHKRIILLVNEPAEEPSVAEKIAAFEAIVRDQELCESKTLFCGTHYWDNSFDAAYAHMDAAWSLRPTAIFTVSDPGAWAALKWLAERRVAVPRDVSVLGFEDVGPSRYTHPALTTIAHPIVEMARQAVAMLVEGGRDHVRLAPHLVVRESTGSPPDA